MQGKDRFGWSGTKDGEGMARERGDRGQGVATAQEGVLRRRPSSGESGLTRRCPRCGQILFSDMDVCYGCLYDFSRDHATRTLPPPPEVAGRRERPPLRVDDIDEPVPPTAANVSRPVRRPGPMTSPEDVVLLIRTGDVDILVPVPKGGLRVGRAPSNDVVLHSKAVSREHVLVMPGEGGVVVHDLGSTNPPLHKGRPIEGAKLIPCGETFVLCGAHFEPRAAR